MKKHINLEHKLIKINAPDILIDQSPKIESESKFELPNHYHGATRTLSPLLSGISIRVHLGCNQGTYAHCCLSRF